MRISGLLRVTSTSLTTHQRTASIAIAAVLLTGVLAFAVIKVRCAQSAIDTNLLSGKLFITRLEWGRVNMHTRSNSQIMVMNANGMGSRIMSKEFDAVRDLVWYPMLESLGLASGMMSDSGLKPGLYTLKLKGQSVDSVSVDKIERSIPDDFRTMFFAPHWEFKNGRNIQALGSADSRDYSTRVTYSPDGRWIAGIATFFSSEDQRYEMAMCVVPADGSSAEKCNRTVRPCITHSPVWSPDSSKIVFTGALKEDATSCNLAELFVVDTNMTSEFQLTNVSGPRLTVDETKQMVKPGMKLDTWQKSTHPKWSPDGHWIAFMAYGGIYRIHPDGTDQQLIIRDGSYPAWSPDSSMLMYVVKTSTFLSSSGPSDRIFVAQADGSEQTEIPLHDKCTSKCSYMDLNWAK